MHTLKVTNSVAVLCALATLAATQSTVTLYDMSIEPLPTESGGLEGELNGVLNAVAQGTGPVNASPIAVDAAGATYYAAVQDVSVFPTTRSGRLTTVVLPTPSIATFTLRADASRVYRSEKTVTEIDGIAAEYELEVDCTHDIDDNTSPEDAAIVCKKKLVIEFEDELGETLGRTVRLTTTGQPVAVATVTNPANLALPTTAEESTTRPVITRRPSPSGGVEESDDNEPTSSTNGSSEGSDLLDNVDGGEAETRARIYGTVGAAALVAAVLYGFI